MKALKRKNDDKVEAFSSHVYPISRATPHGTIEPPGDPLPAKPGHR